VTASLTLSDRFKVLFNGAFPDITISPQVLLSCDENSNGCSGGDFMTAFSYIYSSGITDETCEVFTATGFDEGYTCGSFFPCYTCDQKNNCYVPRRYSLYNISSLSLVSGESEMISALQSGPIACGIFAGSDFVNYTQGVILGSVTGNISLNHAVEIIGYLEVQGVKVWKGRNVWGNYWGDSGFFFIQRGNNTLGIEQYCGVPTPDPIVKLVGQEISKGVDLEKGKVLKDLLGNKRKGLKVDLVQDLMSPQSHDWRNVSGINFLTVVRNQNVPGSCEASWAFATTSLIADRVNILLNATRPDLSLSPQVLINCKAGGSCEGGNSEGVYRFAREVGLPDDTCQQYLAKNPNEFSCSPVQICKSCDKDGCFPVQGYKKWFVKDFGYIAGAERMKSEIWNNGPVGCGLEATQSFIKYQGGIFSQKLKFPRINHQVAVVGWGVEGNEEFWICRNSWGSFWGEQGYFRILMHRDNLGIETDCDWGIPDLSRTNY
jgi:cathepsin X